ncbi:hypothetical protein CAPTEDRAFT_48258, partial [Capitella teleta]
MAGSRAEKIGTVFTRVTGLLRSGALKHDDRPLWYDVMAAFPPSTEPKYDRLKLQQPPRNILYPEDNIRAKFSMAYSSPGVYDMRNPNDKSICQKFVDKYREIEKSTTEGDIFEATAKALEAEGIHL